MHSDKRTVAQNSGNEINDTTLAGRCFISEGHFVSRDPTQPATSDPHDQGDPTRPVTYGLYEPCGPARPIAFDLYESNDPEQ